MQPIRSAITLATAHDRATSAPQSRVTAEPAPTANDFESVMRMDPCYHVVRWINPVSAAAARSCLRLASTSRTLHQRVWGLPFFRASIQWLRTLDQAGEQFRGKLYDNAFSGLIHAPSDVSLPHWPDAQQTRTDILINRLAWYTTHDDRFHTLLSELFKQTKDHTLTSSPGLFIDPRHLPLAVLSTFARNFGFGDRRTRQTIKQLIPTLGSLSTQHLAAFLAELAIGYRDDPRRQALASSALDVLLDQGDELPVLREFVNQAIEFLQNPEAASPECIAAMIDHLSHDGALLSPSSVDLMLALAERVPPPEDTALPHDQSSRLQQWLARYVQAINALHTGTQMPLARSHMFRIPTAWLISAFSKLPPDDKLKIVAIVPNPPDTPYVYLRDSEHWVSTKDDVVFYQNLHFTQLQKCLPMIEYASRDSSIPVRRRRHLVTDLIDRLDRKQIKQYLSEFAHDLPDRDLELALWDLREDLNAEWLRSLLERQERNPC